MTGRALDDAGALHLDEPAWSLREFVQQVPGKGLRRLQEVRVVRRGEIVCFEADLGPAAAFKAGPVLIPSGYYLDPPRNHYKAMEYVVGELMTMAEEWRDRPPLDSDLEFFATAQQKMDEALEWEYEEGQRQLAKQSTFGPGGHRTRG